MTSEFLEKAIKIISSSIAIITLLFGVYQYKKNNEMDFRKSIYNEKLEVYNDIMNLGSEIVNANVDSVETKTFYKHYIAYRKLHYGKLNLVSDSIVNRSSYNFLYILEKYRRPGSRVTPEEMQQLLIRLSESCKRSLENTWVKDVNEILISH